MKISIVFRLSLHVLLSSFATAETQYGVLGFGIPMYQPLCCYSCHDALSALYLNCTTFSEDMNMHHDGMEMKLLKRMDMGSESMATTSDACYASDRVWLETFSNCIHEKCSKDGVDKSIQVQCFSNLAANGQPVSSLQASLPSNTPTGELDIEATWLNSTSLVNEHAYLANYVTMKEFVLSEHRHTRYAFANLALAIFFSGRNNLLMYITGWSQSTMLAIHRWASRVATVQAVVHSIIYTITYFWTGGSVAYQTEAAKPYYWWGIIATIVLCLAIGFAVLPIRTRSYEIFLITHIAFAILALMGCWYHIDLRFGNKWGYKVWLYIAFAFWAFDRLMRFGRLLYFNSFGSPIAVVKQIPHTDILQMTIYPKQAWNVRPGQHSFLYIPLLGKPWENHPFTIASWSGSEPGRHTPVVGSTFAGKEAEAQSVEIDCSSASQHSHESQHPHRLVCLMRARKGMTASLLRKLQRSGASSLPISILTEGLYGGYRTALLPLKTADTILCVAGGIGITSCMSFLQQYSNESLSTASTSREVMGHTSNFVLAWSAREESLIQHVSTTLLPDSAAE
ncbi:unnamed protein product [Aureobasidium uvarum]|uniref:FAD-binding FR-type domain-containing protein n=1 Tax=Aureobasidium uvarum TaxID=2773716 RepID=A0A9N8KNP2_9PEZI|nr:unnamed protein product [Aureobasidium uvarum]